MKYDHAKIEKKWQKEWTKHPELCAADDKSDKPKQYILDMFPYPSGDGLHIGHVEGYTASDIMSRYARLCGKNVLHPQGWDAFGLPAENFAIKTKVHPAATTKKAIATFKKQMNMLGFSYDWSREVNSSDPEYYKWTQWFFLLLYKNGLAYKKKGKVNWCDNCQTVLANEQAEGGVCDRCSNEVVQKDLEQWYFSITKFIEPSEARSSERQRRCGDAKDGRITSGLLEGLEKLDWPDSTKAAQKNWIGKSEGAQFRLPVILSPKGEESKRSFAGAQDDNLFLEVFTTRLDTVFGMSFALIAPEHELVQKLKSQISNWSEVEKYIALAKKKTDLQRQTEAKEKTGVELEGVKVKNPFTKQAIPLFASDFVLAHYGTGAVMAVPAHDERDFEFAKKFKLPINFVILNEAKRNEESKNRSFAGAQDDEAFVEDGILTNSGEYDGLTSEKAREKIAKWLEKEGIGKKVINYKLRDWLVSRQRYWGAPIPIIYCDKCGEIPVPEEDLPVRLPDDVDFMPTGESPLAKSKKFQDVKCPECGGPARREADTMDTFVCSSWYYLRYSDNKNDKEFASKEMLKKWLPVDLYIGGAEHVVLHLLYARFFTKVLHKLGYINFDEPFLKLRHQGIILAEDGTKMSKSKGNVVNPDDVVKEYGADALRMFEMFMGPLEDMKPWNTKGIVGIVRFLERVWNLYHKADLTDCGEGCKDVPEGMPQLLHKTIKKVTEDIENLRFNTAISQMMIFINFIIRFNVMPRGAAQAFLILLAPFAPHMAEELWSSFAPASAKASAGKNASEDKSEEKDSESIFKQSWPKFNPAMVKDETIQMPVQINGKVRAILTVPADISEDEAKKLSMSDINIIKWLEGKEPKKVIFVKGKLVNIVV
ncbi:MAG: leucine--tRNA ligase [Candidatus Portnoybacteria bacterium]|nr:leucine--tRNA ligase [Candidatus Portnoybacteria bacterium]MDD4982792.1 leucine--tRNA ligase [Candidatus Portnoybacteria bacterium]